MSGSCFSLGSRRSCSRLRRRRLIITTHHSSTYHITTSHHNSSQLITSQLITVPLLTPHLSHHNFSSQLITTYHIPTHHSSTSHTTSHTSLITSEPITAPLLTPDITSPLLTPHFSHLPEVHIKLRYIKAGHVGLSSPFICVMTCRLGTAGVSELRLKLHNGWKQRKLLALIPGKGLWPKVVDAFKILGFGHASHVMPTPLWAHRHGAIKHRCVRLCWVCVKLLESLL